MTLSFYHVSFCFIRFLESLFFSFLFSLHRNSHPLFLYWITLVFLLLAFSLCILPFIFPSFLSVLFLSVLNYTFFFFCCPFLSVFFRSYFRHFSLFYFFLFWITLFFSFAGLFSLYSSVHISVISPCFISFLDSIPFTFFSFFSLP